MPFEMSTKIFHVKYSICDLMIWSCAVVIIIYCILPWRFASHYSYLSRAEMEEMLVDQTTRNITLQELSRCDYGDLLDNNHYTFTPHYRGHVLHGENILPGGEFYPKECRARYSTAIIIPYRQREEQLNTFLIYMHNYLRQQRIHYRIFVVEQYDRLPFNRAKLFNIGSVVATEYGFPCLILTDVDLLPLNSGQLYACTQQPRHMCSALDVFRFHLPYTGLFGGVVAISTEQFREINGMSNMYHGWGGEDDDLYERVEANNYHICRFAPEYSEYTMLKHKSEKPNENRRLLLQTAALRFRTDGLNSLQYKEKERRVHSLFTHILVET